MWIDDSILAQCQKTTASKVWIPDTTLVVLGRSNKADSEVNLNFTGESGIEVLTRRGGGGTVVLYPGCLVVSLGLWVNNYYENSFFFAAINSTLIDCIESFFGRKDILGQNGISDIVSVLEPKKIAGTSMFRSRGYLLYQASILGKLDIDLISQCLKHPSREPDYRAGRSHYEFLTDLESVFGMSVDLSSLQLFLSEQMPHALKSKLSEYLVHPTEDHVLSIKSRIESAP